MDISLAKVAVGLISGLPVSFLAYRLSVERCIVRRPLRGATRKQA